MPDPTYTRITWDGTGERLYETGTDHGVLYVMKNDGTYDTGVAWNGLTAVTESPEGAEPTDLWADNIKYLTLRSAETFKFTVEAYTYPDEFAACNGELELVSGVPGLTVGQQPRKAFGMCYRTVVGNDVQNNDYGYKLHIIYGATCSPSEKAYATINDSPEAITFSWEATSTPIIVDGVAKPIYQITIDSTKLPQEKQAALTSLEDMLYGVTTTTGTNPVAGSAPTLPTPEQIIDLFD